ncbi:hypothetical protein KORDIASMS9_01821 [Kordia sp. SMS9]|uniref:hypothetical protein n=1 Tax=Kordia sp. SMS9 TaxID=2282170 RepID=UPI000E0D847A|nr:hypothetical protein [Kordia sp. SMS9]AXG69596.1 hypothetical protein KORDIASMS9_01821 [Kordia sp. SMS9]
MKTKLIILSLFLCAILACSSDDDSGTTSQTGTVKFEVIVSQNRDADIITLIDSNSETTTNPAFPFTKIYSDASIATGTTLQLSFTDTTNAPNGATFSYDLELKISVDNVVVKSQTFAVDETNTTGLSITHIIP